MRNLYFILAVLAGVMFGSTGVFVRSLTRGGVDSTTLLFLRFSIACIIMLIAILIYDKSLLKVNLKDLGLFLVCGLCIVGLNLCYNTSINMVSLSLAAVLLSTAPVFVLIFAYFLFNEKITYQKIIAICLAICGCILVSGLLEQNLADISYFGIICGLGSALFWAFYMLASQKSIEMSYHTFSILFYGLLFITIALIPFTDFNQIVSFVRPDVTFNILFLVMHSLVSFSLPYIFVTISLNYIDSGVASIFTSASEPLAALIYGMLIYNEIPTLFMMTGLVLTIIAIVFLSLKKEDLRSLFI